MLSTAIEGTKSVRMRTNVMRIEEDSSHEGPMRYMKSGNIK